MSRGKAGHIYCFSHPMLITMGENVFKLGCSVDLEGRAKSTQTFMSNEMECLHSEGVKDKFKAEGMVFEALKEFRMRKDREFFQVCLEIIKRVMKNVAEEVNKMNFVKKIKRKGKYDKNKYPDLTEEEFEVLRNILNRVGKQKMCLRCGETYCTSIYNRHVSRRKVICKSYILNITYDEMNENYDYWLKYWVKDIVAKRNVKKEYSCDFCSKIYQHPSSLSRHKHKCIYRKNYKLEEHVNELENENQHLKYEIQQLKSELEMLKEKMMKAPDLDTFKEE